MKAPWIIVVAAAGCGTNLTPEPGAAPASTLDCLPNLDHQIDRDELPFPTNATGSYWVSSVDTSVDVIGTPAAAGTTRWDWSAIATTDALVDVQASSLAGAWFAPMFPSGELVAPLDLDHTVVGVLVRDAQAISLLGIASVTADPPEGKTLVVYDTPIPLYEFPITAGSHWASTGVISAGHGTIEGLPFIGTNTYESVVTATGELDLPELSFTQVYELASTVTVQPDGAPAVTTRTVSFMFECFGEVARATARDGETASAFPVAREVRRLGYQ